MLLNRRAMRRKGREHLRFIQKVHEFDMRLEKLEYWVRMLNEAEPVCNVVKTGSLVQNVSYLVMGHG